MPTHGLWALFFRWFGLAILCAVTLTSAMDWWVRLDQRMIQVSTTLEGLGGALTPTLAPLVASGDTEAVAQWLAPLAEVTGTRVTLTDAIGLPLYDSRSLPLSLPAEQLPELRQALAGEVGVDRRLDGRSGHRLVFLALPIQAEGRTLGALRLVESDAMARTMSRDAVCVMMWTIILVLALAGVAAWVAGRRIGGSIRSLQQLAEQFAEGALEDKPSPPDIAELRNLAGALRRMAVRLDQRIRHEAMQRMEEEAILAGMIEGVLAVDRDERVLRMNPTAGRLLGVSPEMARGRAAQEVAPHADLLRFLSEALERRDARSANVTLKTDPVVRLEVQAVPLYNDQKRFLGVALTMHDVTRLLRLEKVRSDFVANVSHELRTPITSIKGYLETLQDSPLEDKEEMRRFLAIIHKHADRLNAIIEDLLRLSRLEQEDTRGDMNLSAHDLRDIIQSATQMCQTRIAEKGVQMRIEETGPIAAPIDPPLLEQALVNLIDNAVKYSDPGGEIAITLARSGAEVALTVRDRGCGIPHEEQGRLFERFYRVDKARSRTLGGTGLGLAIVKHIVQLHRGRVAVESQVGVGSAFTLYLPAA